MFKNYIKLAFKVLGRRKFFTFISLFGISLTLMILMVITAFLDNELGAHAPISEINRMAFINQVSKQRLRVDTIYTYDTTYVNEVAKIDSTMNISEGSDMTSTSSSSFNLLDKYYRELPFVENYSFYSGGGVYDVFVDGKKLAVNYIYTDDRYWQVFDFTFLEGGSYGLSAVDNQEQVVVISNETKASYFGTTDNVVGEEMILDGKHYKVIGVLEKVSSSRDFVKADLYIPYTHMRSSQLKDTDVLGGFEAVFVMEKPSRLEEVRDEINRISQTIPLPDEEEYNYLEVRSFTYSEAYSQSLIYNEDPTKSQLYVFLILVGLLSLFVILPTINLINVNVTRILERSSEIGVRKAFGANQSNLLVQFVFENVILTIIGGALGLIFAYTLINIINNSQALGELELVFNPSTFVYSLFITLFFGIVSGLIPAWRMSKIHIVNALKENLS